MRGLARWSFTHRRIVVAAWLAALVARSQIHSAAGSKYKDSFRLPGTDSFDALNLPQNAAPKAAGDTDRIVVASKQGQPTDPPTQQPTAQMPAPVGSRPPA